MLDLLLKVNRVMRSIVMVIGAVMVICKVTEKKAREINTSDEGFQIKEFDDIW